tara:strand:+ start:4262 stop:5260 length:999 start_codon:yes stop_codon:yes gene_type:complete
MDLFFSFFVFNLLLLFLNEKIILLFNTYDVPDKKRKIHKYKVSLSGGFFLYLNFLLFFIIYFINQNNNENIVSFFGSSENFIIFFFISSIFFIFGYFDDKLNISANYKLFFSSILIILILLLDNSLIISLINFSFVDNIIYLGRYKFFFTLICFLLFINAFNMFDGINLQAGLYSLYLFVIYLFITDNLQLFIPFVVPLILFLYLNYKNKVFLGNSGSLFLSFSISYFAIKIFNNNFDLYSDEIFLLMILPGIDMLRLFFVRLLNKKSPFKPDKQHMHHYLLNKFKYKLTIVISIFLSTFPFILSFVIESYFVLILFLMIYFIFFYHLRKYY